MTKKERVHVFIDASNLWQMQKAKGKFFDYEKLSKYLKIKFDADAIKIFYYTGPTGTQTVTEADMPGTYTMSAYAAAEQEGQKI